jgi:hypothetical protein
MLSNLKFTHPDAIMAAIDLGNLAFWEARERAEERLAEVASGLEEPVASRLWLASAWAQADLRPVARALTLTAWFNRMED